jgi:hypothetical protein
MRPVPCGAISSNCAEVFLIDNSGAAPPPNYARHYNVAIETLFADGNPMRNLTDKTCIVTTREVSHRCKYIRASLNILVGDVLDLAVKELQAKHKLPDPPALRSDNSTE